MPKLFKKFAVLGVIASFCWVANTSGAVANTVSFFKRALGGDTVYLTNSAWKIGASEYCDEAGANCIDVAGTIVAETDPIVGAITGLIKADGAGAISAAVAGADFAAIGANADITSMTALTSITRATGGIFNFSVGSAAGDDFTVDTDKLVVEGDTGNIGIGTTAPDAKLHIVGGITLDQLAADLADPDAGDSNFWFGDGTGTGDAGDLYFKTNVAASIKTWNPYDYSIGGMPVSALGSGTDGELITWDASGLPATIGAGTAGQVLTSNGAGAAPTFQAAGGGGANTSLSNLSSLAINTSLLPGADVSVNLGTGDLRFKDAWIATISSGLTANDTLKLRGRDLDATAYVDVLTITSNDTVTADLNAITTIGGNAILYSGGALGTPSGGTLTNCTFPTLNQNTTGTAANLSGTPALPSGTTATTQAASDNSTKIATTAYVDAAAVAGGTLTGNITFGENTSLVHDNALSADEKYTGETIAGTAGAALAFGDLVYFDPTDSRWELADANVEAGADGDPRGILGLCVLAAAGDGSATTILLRGFIRADTAFPTFTINAPVYVREIAGDVVVGQPTTADVVIRVLGFGYTADSMYFNPSNDYITHT